VRELGDCAFAVAADVLDAASLSAAVTAAEKQLGPIDIAVNNAGGIVTSDGELFRPFESVSDEDWSMANFPLFTTESEAGVGQLQSAFGMVPNIAAVNSATFPRYKLRKEIDDVRN
jgi:NAD(P)-dependent dehydrogenase (short-subunit alcohol dehydrogenase family)